MKVINNGMQPLFVNGEWIQPRKPALKTAQLTGAQLDYWVAKAMGLDFSKTFEVDDTSPYMRGCEKFQPSTNWAQGGPIIERYGISLDMRGGDWVARTPLDQVMIADDEPLCAAMLAICVLKFGWNLPDE
jgi:hypothetical protein